MLHFCNDYSEGAHPRVMRALADSNMESTAGYGCDPYCEAAREALKARFACPEADVHFLVGGTQTNLVAAAAFLRPWEAVIAAELAASDAIDAKDTYTNGHSRRVAKYSMDIAGRLGYSDDQMNDIYLMGLLHDIGKIGIPDAVINKPARLNDEEFEMIKNHPVMGARILKNIGGKPGLQNGARWHHERYGGGGYPDNLKGEDIPKEARIIAVADAYDAMSSRRSYRGILPQDVVRSEIEKGKGTQFDPEIADVMLKLIDEDKDYNMREQG